MTHLTKPELKKLNACLRVEAVTDTRRGLSNDFVPAGTVGYVLGHRKSDDTYLIHWDRPRQYTGDWRTGSHSVADVKAVGRGVA